MKTGTFSERVNQLQRRVMHARERALSKWFKAGAAMELIAGYKPECAGVDLRLRKINAAFDSALQALHDRRARGW
jgi:hypothetical protein